MREFNLVVSIINDVFNKNSLSPLTIQMENQSGNSSFSTNKNEE